ncbi:hypothetical protein EDEG_00480 [Edhazardia aedis USNM 41457]|uniref:NEDD8-activating enzyme E1 catalytic subunit n=1 Tax=Edhazardia aedis (strain USNM 41457) TaxID=1003232 RepID=J9DIX6_EDHAE|nr:hypothetical protein EDEG_00480 [Edhazardia aedis USNM 41457]|eukprot:EJW01337.1 hypothetical protein EDEG_00480 [Edhazardia aedis USNM 41457]
MSQKILVVGCGGIACELIKLLYLNNKNQITLVDFDTISLSNLNRQFIFRKQNIGMYKCKVMSEVYSRMLEKSNSEFFERDLPTKNLFSEKYICDFNPLNGKHVIKKRKILSFDKISTKEVDSDKKGFSDFSIPNNVIFIAENIMTFDIVFFSHFDIIYNCLDNIEARSFVNRQVLFLQQGEIINLDNISLNSFRFDQIQKEKMRFLDFCNKYENVIEKNKETINYDNYLSYKISYSKYCDKNDVKIDRNNDSCKEILLDIENGDNKIQNKTKNDKKSNKENDFFLYHQKITYFLKKLQKNVTWSYDQFLSLSEIFFSLRNGKKTLLIDGGSTGFLGQSWEYGAYTECYDCLEKDVDTEIIPICTIRNKPEKYDHCITWTKSVFFEALNNLKNKNEWNLNYDNNVSNKSSNPKYDLNGKNFTEFSQSAPNSTSSNNKNLKNSPDTSKIVVDSADISKDFTVSIQENTMIFQNLENNNTSDYQNLHNNQIIKESNIDILKTNKTTNNTVSKPDLNEKKNYPVIIYQKNNESTNKNIINMESIQNTIGIITPDITKNEFNIIDTAIYKKIENKIGQDSHNEIEKYILFEKNNFEYLNCNNKDRYQTTNLYNHENINHKQTKSFSPFDFFKYYFEELICDTENNKFDKTELKNANLIDNFNYMISKLILRTESIEFDKDDEDIISVLFIVSVIRARSFGIKENDRLYTENKAGNIIPAICTTNSIVACLMYFCGEKSLNKLKNSCKINKYENYNEVEGNNTKKYLEETIKDENTTYNYYLSIRNNLLRKNKSIKWNSDCKTCISKKFIFIASPAYIKKVTLKMVLQLVLIKIGSEYSLNDLTIFHNNELIFDRYFRDNVNLPLNIKNNELFYIEYGTSQYIYLYFLVKTD